ncbi:carbohydrate ABC transporter substrate-binding protein [Sphingomonas mollis]|uniref:Carbohydrate ABC transporter substrate-binding protein n=1 Tax=Sphingomonas mollis TaxID=2795726 RepID=A0ABS0XTN7_9SPHN|nr:carbohydrate ABC transporter substrate-binding protein [Sphingomonas sp. BT553]MBJ6123415.1 carbohydrate ABC transporter substrate-binding protein [Sphingomonas sp. BT553]
MTWNHPRGVDPLVAASARWQELTGVAIEWEGRSLQDFESYPVEDLARRYDLIVIDHPHVGQICAADCLVPLDTVLGRDVLDDVARGSIGGSYESYRWAGRQWALPIDAAAQVMAWVPGRIGAPPADPAALPALVRDGTALIPLRAPHALMTLFTLCGLGGIALDVTADALFPDDAAVAYDRLSVLADAADDRAWAMDPIDVFEAMAQPASPVAVAPFIYGYVSYAQPGFRDTRIRFGDLPHAGPDASTVPYGSALGGTGIAVSRFGADPAGAARFAGWIASGAVQRDLVGTTGGQPAHAAAWDSVAVNRIAGDFYTATRRTLDLAWLRPRHDGYMEFQRAASERLEQALRAHESAQEVIAALNRLYGESR